MVSFKQKKRSETRSLLVPRRSDSGGDRFGEPRSDDDFLEEKVDLSMNRFSNKRDPHPRTIQSVLTSTTTTSDPPTTTGSLMSQSYDDDCGSGGATPPLTPESDNENDDDELISGGGGYRQRPLVGTPPSSTVATGAPAADPPGHKLIAASDSSSLVQNLLCMMDKACVAPMDGEWGSSSPKRNTATFNTSHWTTSSAALGETDLQSDLKRNISQHQQDDDNTSQELEKETDSRLQPPEVVTEEPSPAKFEQYLEPQKGEKLESFEVILREKTPPRRKKLGKGLMALLHLPHRSQSNNSGLTPSTSPKSNSKTLSDSQAQQKDNSRGKPRRRHRDSDGRFHKPLTAISDPIPIEEEKKDEDQFSLPPPRNHPRHHNRINQNFNATVPKTINAPPITRNLAKEVRYKQVLGTWMNTRTPLETITEDEHKPLPSSTSSPTAVRVPGIENPDKYLSHSDLIGDEVISTPKHTSMHDNNTNQEDTLDSHPTNPIQKTRSWMGMGKWLGFGGSEDDEDDENSNEAAGWSSQMLMEPENLTPQSSSLTTITTDNNSSDNNTQKQRLWKIAVCPNTGRTYYYHRVTRRATWSKPPEDELILPKNGNADSSKENKLQVSEEDEIKQVRFPVLSKQTEAVLLAKHEILELLQEMGQGPTAVDKLLAQYEGRELELLDKLRLAVQDRPFDEAMHRSLSVDGTSTTLSILGTVADKSTVVSASSSKSLQGRSRTQSSFVSGISSALMSASTQPVRNTGRGRSVETAPATPDLNSHATSISSKQGDIIPLESTAAVTPQQNQKQNTNQDRVPSNIPVPRTRDLFVEEFNYRRDDRRERGVIRATPPQPSLPETVDPTPYFGDNEDADTKETDSLKNDSISALSEADLSFTNMDVQIRRALDEAIACEDWDRAAMLSNSLRVDKWKSPEKKQEWTQTDLDRFISSNDWDAVANYLAQVRAAAATSPTTPTTPTPSSNNKNTSRTPKVSKTIEYCHSPQKRFGAKSQLQHKDMLPHKAITVRNESWESASYSSYDESEYSSSSSSSDTYEELMSARRRKNFAC